MIVEVDEKTVETAAAIHSESWTASHAGFCSSDFLVSHTPARQTGFLRRELAAGKRLYMLVRERPVGVVSVAGDLIENLYILPAEQNKGCGTELLLFAVSQCAGAPRLWILDNNLGARALYSRHGFRPTGRRNAITPTLTEFEMRLDGGRAL